MSAAANLPRVTHRGPVRIGDIEMDAAVLDDGRCGFLSSALAAVLGTSKIRGKERVSGFRNLVANFAPKYLSAFDIGGCPVLLPDGVNVAKFYPHEVLTGLLSAVVRAALQGKLHAARAEMAPRCQDLQEAFAAVGVVAWIHEGTGYQAERAPDGLQQVLDAVLRKEPDTWQRRFHPGYYHYLMRLLGLAYTKHGPLPAWIGGVTWRWVYQAVFPPEILQALNARRREAGTGEKVHQWLQDGGIRLVVRQIEAVTTVARCSASTADFEAQCSHAFDKPGQLGILFQLPAPN